MKSRAEAVAWLAETRSKSKEEMCRLVGVWGNRNMHRGEQLGDLPHHFGRVELMALLDFIYEGLPATADEFVPERI